MTTLIEETAASANVKEAVKNRRNRTIEQLEQKNMQKEQTSIKRLGKLVLKPN